MKEGHITPKDSLSLKPYTITTVLILLVFGALAGVIANLYSKWSLIIVVCILFSAIYFHLTRGLPLWQKGMIFLLVGYMILGYGFTNVSVHLGKLIIPIGMLGATLFLFNIRHSITLTPFLKEKAFMFLIAWVTLSIVRIAYDVQKYGIWALRDATIVFEAIFVYFGYIWAYKKERQDLFIKLIAIIFILHFLYVLAYPWRTTIIETSPQVTAIRTVPLFGSYGLAPVHLIAGSIFFLMVAKHYFRAPSWLLWGFAALQLAPLGMLQQRSSYITLGVIIPILYLFRQRRIAFNVVGIIAILLIAVMFISLLGIQIPGRIETLSLEFLFQHILAIFGKGELQGPVGGVGQRLDWWVSTITITFQSPLTALVGQGFGIPLTDFRLGGDISVRQPHNSFISILSRTGLIGFVFWMLFNLYFIKAVMSAIHHPAVERKDRDILTWLFLYYVAFVVIANFQPALEFSFGAVPFYFLVGFTLHMSKSTIDRRENSGEYEPKRI